MLIARLTFNHDVGWLARRIPALFDLIDDLCDGQSPADVRVSVMSADGIIHVNFMVDANGPPGRDCAVLHAADRRALSAAVRSRSKARSAGATGPSKGFSGFR
jgi:FAD/FMN-containing dehydrogenase